MLKRFESYFKGNDKVELYYQAWHSEKPKGTLVITHGLGEHSDCYERLIKGLETFGWNIYAWDLRSHGRSSGQRGVVKNFYDFVSDLSLFWGKIKQEVSHPCIFFGHSMGGLITSCFLQYENEDPSINGVVFSSPLFGVGLKIPKLKKKLAEISNKIMPGLTMYNEVRFKQLSSDPEVIESYARDPLRHDRINSSLFLGILEYTEKLEKKSLDFKLPVLLQIAGDESVVSNEASLKFFNTIQSNDKTLIKYDGFLHEIYNEKNRQKVIEDLKHWLKKFEK